MKNIKTINDNKRAYKVIWGLTAYNNMTKLTIVSKFNAIVNIGCTKWEVIDLISPWNSLIKLDEFCFAK